MIRRIRIEIWMQIAAFALGRALDTCRMPDDLETVVQIREATRGMLSGVVRQ